MKEWFLVFLAVLGRSPGAQLFIVLAVVLPVMLLLVGQSMLGHLRQGAMAAAIGPVFGTVYQVMAGALAVGCLWCAGGCYFKTRKRLLGL